MSGSAARPWLLGVVAVLAAAGGAHVGLGVDHGLDREGLSFGVAGAAQLLLAVLVAARPSARVRAAALVALLGPGVAWFATRTSLDGGDGGVLGFGLVVALLELLAAAVLWALPGRRTEALGGRRLVAVPVLAVLGVLAVGVVPTQHGHDHRHAPPASASTDADAAPTESIFGDLFAGHDAGHDH